MFRKVMVTAGVLAVLASGSPAQAATWAGACALDVTFNFTTPVRAPNALAQTVSRPNYSISVAQSKDLNPLTGAVEACHVSPAVLAPFRSTWAWGGGTSSIWTCESTLASGTWNEGWSSSIPLVYGSHLIKGGPDGWSMTVHDDPSLRLVGTMELTVHPDDALKLAQCETSGITSLKMTGVLAFQYS